MEPVEVSSLILEEQDTVFQRDKLLIQVAFLVFLAVIKRLLTSLALLDHFVDGTPEFGLVSLQLSLCNENSNSRWLAVLLVDALHGGIVVLTLSHIRVSVPVFDDGVSIQLIQDVLVRRFPEGRCEPILDYGLFPPFKLHADA